MLTRGDIVIDRYSKATNFVRCIFKVIKSSSKDDTWSNRSPAMLQTVTGRHISTFDRGFNYISVAKFRTELEEDIRDARTRVVSAENTLTRKINRLAEFDKRLPIILRRLPKLVD